MARFHSNVQVILQHISYSLAVDIIFYEPRSDLYQVADVRCILNVAVKVYIIFSQVSEQIVNDGIVVCF